jgi:dTDP-4-amino-4,6-dideoxygalactose transaminase
LGAARVLLTGSCTSAMELAYMTLGLGPGDEVLMPSFTFTSTATAALRAGARPIFCDIDPDTFNLSLASAQRFYSRKTKAIVVVHYAGRGCDMRPILAWAKSRGLAVIEDAAHAFGARHQGRPLGAWGDFGCFSFHQTKNVVCGEGGALAIRDRALSRRAEWGYEKGTDRLSFQRGEIPRYQWVAPGGSFTMGEVLAGLLESQIGRMPLILKNRRRIAHFYFQALAGGDGFWALPAPDVRQEMNWHIFALRVPSSLRDALLAWMKRKGVGASSHYEPLHTSRFARETWGKMPRLETTERVAGEIVRLPIYPRLTRRDAAYVSDCVRDFFAQSAVRSFRGYFARSAR